MGFVVCVLNSLERRGKEEPLPLRGSETSLSSLALILFADQIVRFSLRGLSEDFTHFRHLSSKKCLPFLDARCGGLVCKGLMSEKKKRCSVNALDIRS
ncbi:hypothetical protein ES708_04966 [subsurface metagenome]